MALTAGPEGSAGPKVEAMKPEGQKLEAQKVVVKKSANRVEEKPRAATSDGLPRPKRGDKSVYSPKVETAAAQVETPAQHTEQK